LTLSLLGDDAFLVGLEDALLAEAHVVLAVEIERVRIPPHDRVIASARAMRAWGDRVFAHARNVIGPVAHAVLPEGGAAWTRRRRASFFVTRVNDVGKGVRPPRNLLVAAHWHNQELARACRGDVREAHRLLAIMAQHFIAVFDELDGRALGERHGPQSARRVDVA
jgi:hypothetical protein